jgi:hypothetical protein
MKAINDFDIVDFYLAQISSYHINLDLRFLEINLCQGVTIEGANNELHSKLTASSCLAKFTGLLSVTLEIYEYTDRTKRDSFKYKKEEKTIFYDDFPANDMVYDVFPFSAILTEPFVAYTNWEIQALKFSLEYTNLPNIVIPNKNET